MCAPAVQDATDEGIQLPHSYTALALLDTYYQVFLSYVHDKNKTMPDVIFHNYYALRFDIM
eukprot:3693856-Amphidinium_carterae.2